MMLCLTVTLVRNISKNKQYRFKCKFDQEYNRNQHIYFKYVYSKYLNNTDVDLNLM